MAAATKSVPDPRTALLDAAESILVGEGYPAATTRVIAARAGVNHGLVHYYFGSVDNLLMDVLSRFTDRLHHRQQDLYSQDIPFVDKWRTAMGYLVSGDGDYSKIWLELQAMSWNKPDFCQMLREVNEGWREILARAFDDAASEFGQTIGEAELEGLVALVMTFNLGVQIESAGGVTQGHQQMLDMIDRYLVGLGERNR